MTPTTTDQPRLTPAAIVLTVFVPFGLGYYLSYLFRAVNAVIAPQLVADIGLTAADLGLMTSVYFIVFASIQVPLGIVLDRYGPRRVQFVLLAVAAAGAALFALGHDLATVATGRGLIGFGVSGCLMAALQANVLWWPRERLALLHGLTGAFGSMGALSATLPVELLLEPLGWRGIFFVLAAVTLAVGVLILVVVPDRRVAGAATGNARAQLRDLGRIYGDAYFWRVSVMVFVHAAAFLSYQTLWAGPWLRDVAGMDRLEVANALFLHNAGMVIGVLTLGVIADRLQRVAVPTITTVAGAMVLSMAAQLGLALELVEWAVPLLFLFGFGGASTILVYAVYANHFPAALIGRVNTAQNKQIFIGSFIVQWGIGLIIGMWPEPAPGRYAPEAHQVAFFVVLAIELAALVWFLWPRRRGPG